jgi:hypothetical protein
MQDAPCQNGKQRSKDLSGFFYACTTLTRLGRHFPEVFCHCFGRNLLKTEAGQKALPHQDKPWLLPPSFVFVAREKFSTRTAGLALAGASAFDQAQRLANNHGNRDK